MSINDLDSTNGTRVDAFQYQNDLELKGETLENNRDLADFSEFYRNNQQNLEQFYHYHSDGQLTDSQGLRKYIYSNFYNMSESTQPRPELTERQLDAYSAGIKRNEAKIRKLRSVRANMTSEYWSYYHINGGCQRDKEIGRIYLNLEPTSCPDIQLEMVKRCHNAGIAIDTKAPNTMDQRAASRADKMVVYANKEQLSGAKQVIEDIYRKYEGSFLDATPKFTEEIKDGAGRVIRGVAYGDEPRQGGPYSERRSFGEVRSKILAGLCEYAHNNRLEVDFTDQDIVNKFQQLCEKEGVDYKNPARNLTPGGQK